MGPLNSGVVESSSHAGLSTADIPGYVPPCHPNAKPMAVSKNQKDSVKLPGILQGMICTSHIVPSLIRMKYEDNDMLVSVEIIKEPCLPMV